MTAMDIKTLEAQEKDLRFDKFNEATALGLGIHLMTLAQADGLAVVIDIRTPDRTLFHVALPGTTPMNALWAKRKSAVVLAYHASSLLMGERMRAKGVDFARDGLDPAQFANHGGSFPIRAGGMVVAAITVSGLPQLDDHALIIRAMAEFLA
jgi:uncharacterized protein (UPF0303 family)